MLPTMLWLVSSNVTVWQLCSPAAAVDSTTCVEPLPEQPACCGLGCGNDIKAPAHTKGVTVRVSDSKSTAAGTAPSLVLTFTNGIVPPATATVPPEGMVSTPVPPLAFGSKLLQEIPELALPLIP